MPEPAKKKVCKEFETFRGKVMNLYTRNIHTPPLRNKHAPPRNMHAQPKINLIEEPDSCEKLQGH